MELTGNIFIYLTAFLSFVVLTLLYYLYRLRNSYTSVRDRLSEVSEFANNLQYELSSKNNELAQLREQVRTLDSELSGDREKITNLTADCRAHESRSEEKDKLIQSYTLQLDNLRKEVQELNRRILNDQGTISELRTTIEKERENSREKLELLNEAKENLSREFENIGNRIFEDKSKKFTDQNKTNMEVMLNPLREQIKEFSSKVTDIYDKESKERVTLVKQIEHLRDLNKQISQDTINLTNALKGQGSVQGAWGEIVLQKVLEMSGLRKGIEYTTQKSFKSPEGGYLRPDVIINLPEGKQVIIDSKVSLSAFERYNSSEDETSRKNAIRDHIVSINNHIKELSRKGYEDISEIKSLNYVLMFIPVEGAFLAAIENDREVFKNAFDNNIILVCPSTLLATLRTIQGIWQFEYQSRNAQIIAEKAGKLYDRFVEFTSHLEAVGTRIEQASRSHEDAMKALLTGRGNLVKRATGLKKLGIKNKKDLSDNVLNAYEDFEDDETEEDTDSDGNSPFRTPQN